MSLANSFVLTSLADPALHPFCFDIVAKNQGATPSPFIIPLKRKYLSCGSQTVPRCSFALSQPSAGEGPAAVANRAFAYDRTRCPLPPAASTLELAPSILSANFAGLDAPLLASLPPSRHNRYAISPAVLARVTSEEGE